MALGLHRTMFSGAFQNKNSIEHGSAIPFPDMSYRGLPVQELVASSIPGKWLRRTGQEVGSSVHHYTRHLRYNAEAQTQISL